MNLYCSPRLGWLVAAIAALGLEPVRAQTTPPDTQSSAPASQIVQLPQFIVSDTQANPYLPTDTMSVNRVAGSILDSPFSVNVVTQDFMNDIGANATFDATRYMSGMSPGRGTGTAGLEDRQDFRGFESFSKTIDNFSSFLLPDGAGFMANFDPAFIDRIELVMGPDTILSPTGTPGGSANIITKSPEFTRGTDITVEAGNYNAQRLVIDTTGPIGGHWAYRLIAALQDTRTFEPGDVHQTNIGAMVEYDFSSTAKITFKYYMEKWFTDGAIAEPNDNGEMVSAPNTLNGATLSTTPQPGFSYSGWNGNAPWNQRFDTVNIGEVNFIAALGSHVNMRLAGEILYDNYETTGAYPQNSPAETFDPATGEEIGVVAVNPADVPITAINGGSLSRQIQFQNDFAGSFHLGPISLNPVVGWASQAGQVSRMWAIADNNMPAANLYAGYYNPPVPPISDFTSFVQNAPEEASLFQTYGVVRAGFFNDRVFLTGGAARIWADVNDYAFKGIYVPGDGQVGAAPGSAGYLVDYTFNNTGNAIAPTQNDYRDTYIAGALAKVTDQISLYASYSSNAGIAVNNPLWQTGTQYEFGIKSQFFNQRLQLSAAHFQIAESNVGSNNPLFDTGQSTIQTLLENETNHGEEFDLVGGITRDLSVIASFTEMHLRDPLGRRIRNVPDTMANLLLNYHFPMAPLRNLNVFAGTSYEGNVAGETVSGVTALGVPEQPGFYLAPWAVVNAGAGYKWGRYHFNFNLDNALNSKFWWQPASRISVSPYPGITFRFSVTTHI